METNESSQQLVKVQPKKGMSRKRLIEIEEQYEAVDNKRTSMDFMYMMLSNNNHTEYTNQMHYLGDILTNTYGDKSFQHGLNKQTLGTIQWIIESDNRLYQDALWFISLDLLPSLSSWMMQGNPEKNQLPPRLGNVDMFHYFCKNQLKKFREDLLNGTLSLEAFVVACRAEYTVQVGFCVPANR